MLTQTVVLTRLAFLGIVQRKWSALVLIGSVACVVGVLLSMLSVTAGMLRAYRSGEDPQQAVVMPPENSGRFAIPTNLMSTILDAPGIAKGADGHPLAEGEVQMWVPPTGVYAIGSPNLRGIGAAGFALHPHLKLIEGRSYRSGRHEVILGVTAARTFQLKVGDVMLLAGGPWPIVGMFTDDGSMLESEVLSDTDTLIADGQTNGFRNVLVKLDSPAAFDNFSRWIDANPDLMQIARRQSDYIELTANRNSAFFTSLAYAVAAMMALGAVFGTMKLMYAAVSVRIRELATLRAIGYQPLPVALSVLLETIVLALLGALTGVAAAWLLFNDKHVVQARNVFDLSVSPRLVALGILWALALALLGGLPPAIRAARRSVTDALRAV
ncbi:MAG TPA: FtsX-like permease family protein [Steroidobacteraceae bacterium]|jgi:putative ABC transport system permease protein